MDTSTRTERSVERDALFVNDPVAATLRAHTWWHDRNACECGEQPTHEAPYYLNAGGATDWHALHLAEQVRFVSVHDKEVVQSKARAWLKEVSRTGPDGILYFPCVHDQDPMDCTVCSPVYGS